MLCIHTVLVFAMNLPVLALSEPSSCGDLRLAREITLLSAQMNIANYRLLKLISEFDLRGGWRSGGAMRSCAHWLAANCGMAIGAAREKVRVARRLSKLPEVEKAFSSGDLSYSKVRAISRVATDSNEGFLVMMAEQTSASHLEKLVGKYQPVDELELPAALGDVGGLDGLGEPLVGVGDSGVADEEQRRESARELFWFQDKDGMWVIHCKLPPEQGQLVIKMLEAVARPLQEERQEAWNEKQKAQMQAVAQHILRRHRAAGIGADASGGDASVATACERAQEKISAESFSQFMNHVRADAFSAVAEHFLATSGSYEHLQNLKGAERCQVVLHVDINTLRGQGSGSCCTHSHAHFEDKPWLSPQTARRLGCDASLVTVLEDENGKVLNVGRRSRVVPPNIRRALLERDGVCQYPGCHESRYVDAHHIKHWADGGETSLDNLTTLCRFHHRELHRGSFELTHTHMMSSST
jgi:hypothetical protein